MERLESIISAIPACEMPDLILLFLMKGSAEAKFGTDSPADALKAALASGALREFSGFSHAADFKVRFSGSFPSAEEELRMLRGAGSGFRVVFTLLKDVRESCIRPEAERLLSKWGRLCALRESAEALRCAILTEDPAAVLSAAGKGGISRGYMMDFVIVQQPGTPRVVGAEQEKLPRREAELLHSPQDFLKLLF